MNILIKKENEEMPFRIKQGTGGEYVTKTFRMPAELMEKIDSLAYSNNLSTNALVIQCLQYAIDNLDTSEGKDK